MNASSKIVTDLSTANTSFTAAITISNGLLVNRGTINFNGAVTLSGTSIICPEESITNFNWAAAWSLTASGNPFDTYGGNAASYAVINYGGLNAISSQIYPSTKYHICNTGVSNYNAATEGGVSSGSGACSFPPLPVILSHFSATLTVTGIEVIWSTTFEMNNDHFDLERSHDGINFEKITEVKGQDTKNTPSTYVYADTDVNTLLPVYYRLKQVDVDGQFNYSNLIVLNGAEGSTSIDIYPNPLEEGATLYARFGQEDEGKASVSLFDLSGKLIHEYLMDNIQPGGLYAVEDKSLLLFEGTYLLQIKTAQHVYNQKLEVK